jgi:N-acylneuraminate cytidylyltransferase
MNVAIIPARGGSKRIPRKNIRPFLGQPMIAYAITAARTSGCFARIIVSTDDQEIAEVAREWGAEVPFLRPATLADDHTGTSAVIRHALQWLAEQGCHPEFTCCIYATTPLLLAGDLAAALARLKNAPDKSFAFSVTSYAYPIQRALCFDATGALRMCFPEHGPSRSQDLARVVHDAGQFYWGRSAAFLNHLSIFSAHAIPFELPRYRVQDIDDEEDWKRAELMAKALRAEQAEH